MTTSELPTSYITEDADAPPSHGPKRPRNVVIWHELLLVIAAAFASVTFVIYSGLIPFRGQWWDRDGLEREWHSAHVVGVRPNGLVIRAEAPDVWLHQRGHRLFHGVRSYFPLPEQRWVRASEATADQLAGHRLRGKFAFKEDRSVQTIVEWMTVLYVARNQLPLMAIFALCLFSLASSSIGFRSDIIQHAKLSWLAAYTTREGLQFELSELQKAGASAADLRGIHVRSVVAPPLVLILWFAGLSRLANIFRF